MDTSLARGIIAASVDGPVLTITIDNPGKRGALLPDSYRAIGDLVRSASSDPAVRAVIITGDDKAFSSGMDIDVFLDEGTRQTHPELGVRDTLIDIEYMAQSIVRAAVPVIAAVEGACVGIGASVAFLCDLIVASEKAFFTLPFTAIGLIPDGGVLATLTASVGRHRAMDMVLRHTRISARDAYDFGLVTQLAPDALATARDIAQGLTLSPREAVGRTKAAVNQASLAQMSRSLESEAMVQTRLLGSPEHAEGAAAFREKRRPRFT